MPSAHIFTVNSTTFNIHLRYMFAGTGAGTGESGKAEQGGALADILSIRPGDNIIFYVVDHGFYGFFEAVMANNELVFYEPPKNQYLDNELGRKTLTYRLLIRPSQYGIYRFGRNEWDAVENPRKIENASVFKMQWSWIFSKKLSGKRGCITIPEQEFELLKKIIVEGNEKITDTTGYGYLNGQIFPENNTCSYVGDKTRSPILSGNVQKIEKEENLRIFFCAEAGNNEILNEILQPKKYGAITYISNETKCSFGEKSIDLLFFTIHKKCLLIELKNNFYFEDDKIEDIILGQISGYARWVASYKTDLNEIIPILVLREAKLHPERRNGKKYKFAYQSNEISTWYQEQVNTLMRFARELANRNIEKLQPLQIYIFETDNNNILKNFSRLEQ